MSDKVRVGQKVFQLPNGLSFCFFEQTGNAAVLKDDPASAVFNGRSIIDSVDIKGSRPASAKEREVIALVTRHGAKPVAPEAHI